MGLTGSDTEPSDQSREISPGGAAPFAMKGHGISEATVARAPAGKSPAFH
jgi:hypothetical protein